MLVFLGRRAASWSVLLSGALLTAFSANPLLNALIVLVLLIGVGWNIRQVVRLSPEVLWLETFQRARPGRRRRRRAEAAGADGQHDGVAPAKGRDGRSASPSRPRPCARCSTAIASRLDESRELSRYMTGLLIFLGLLGTFWGLLLTVRSVGDVIGGMSVGSGDINALFEQLKSGLSQPLQGMGTAFSSSMLGLAGALVLGFLDLTAGQAQNRFYNELEEWLAGITRLSSGVLGGGGEGGSVPVYVQALLEQTAENMENLQHILSRGEDGRRESNQAVLSLTERIATLSDTMRASQQLMLRVAENQAALGPGAAAAGRSRAETVARRRGARPSAQHRAVSARLLAETEQGRAQSTAELRSDIRVLTRTIAALAEEQPR